MLAAVRSAAVLGIDAYRVTVEVDASAGLPQFSIVGLPAGAVKESRERVGAALVNSGCVLPPRRLTVNLAPADIRKEGSAFDLPIALGILIATGQLAPEVLEGRVFVGELGLDGALRAMRGALPIARLARASDARALVLPPDNIAEAALVSGLALAAPRSLAELIEALRLGTLSITAEAPRLRESQHASDFADVAGQEVAKRALEIAAAGAHNVLLVGPPGAGKTMLARRLPSILPALTEAEALEVTAIHSVAGLLRPGEAMLSTRPFRAPHHSISDAGLIGGGNPPRPGEVSLAHHGVLFLDELLEFRRHVTESLRQPLEDGRVLIARAASAVTFPARFTLVGAMNPCPCGNAGDPARLCHCAAADVTRYRARLSGPLADRIDMHVHVGPVSPHSLHGASSAERSGAMRERVEMARAAQHARFGGEIVNAHASPRQIAQLATVMPSSRELLVAAAERLNLTARSFHRVLRVARTIADLESSRDVHPAHVAEALRYRPVAPAGLQPAATGTMHSRSTASREHG